MTRRVQGLLGSVRFLSFTLNEHVCVCVCVCVCACAYMHMHMQMPADESSWETIANRQAF